MKPLGLVALALGLALALGSGLAAQDLNGRGGREIRMLREAAAREAAGDLAGAEQILRAILADRPTSLSGLLSLERLVVVQGRAEELLPLIRRLLASDAASAIGHQMLLRTYSALDRVPELERAAEAWIRATPRVETPYREAARVWQERGEHARAIVVLERGRKAVGRDDALALELGDLYAGRGELVRAVREWDHAVGSDAAGFNLVRRRLGALPDGGAQVLPSLIEALTRPPVTAPRRRGAVALAIDAGLGERAREIAREAVLALPPSERAGFLVEVARHAEGARLDGLAYWAYSELLGGGGLGDRRLAVESRTAELALAVGDTARARELYLLIEQQYTVGSPARRQAAAVRIGLTARDGAVGEAVRELAAFRQEFPDAPELDRVAAAVAGALLARGEQASAERVVAGVDGPRTSLIRGRMALVGGDVGRARAAFQAAAPALQGAEQTEAIALATLLSRLSPQGGKLLGRAIARTAQGKPQEAVALLSSAAGLATDEHAALLDYAAALADRAQLAAEAEQVRRDLIARYPRALEAPAALLGLARALLERPDGLGEAQQLLERLILEYPRSALVPQARRELDRARGRVPSS